MWGLALVNVKVGKGFNNSNLIELTVWILLSHDGFEAEFISSIYWGDNNFVVVKWQLKICETMRGGKH